ncbi:MAG: neutral zinc metallopeptidase [Saprospiraceae bacterium]|nr:neutral zinc metallopeptidase [Saprospiraceae bacterium]
MKHWIPLLLALNFGVMLHAQKAMPTDDVAEVVQGTTRLLNRFWGSNFKRANMSYVPPTQVIPYAKRVNTACGETLPNNAFYCPTDRSIWYDKNFLAKIHATRGRFAVATVIAHEWGHFIAQELREKHRHSIKAELQADCLAGAFAGWFTEQMPDNFTDYIQGARTLLSMGDRETTPWFAPGAHGAPEQRVQQFFHGFYQGYGGCFDD